MTKSVFSLVNSAVNMTLPAFTVVAPLPLSACCCQSISPVHDALSSKLAIRRFYGRMMGQRQMDI